MQSFDAFGEKTAMFIVLRINEKASFQGMCPNISLFVYVSFDIHHVIVHHL